jgi:hypothetical protein
MQFEEKSKQAVEELDCTKMFKAKEEKRRMQRRIKGGKLKIHTGRDRWRIN